MNPVEYRRMYEAEESHWWYVGLHELILAQVRSEAERLGRPLQILDAGCGTGRLSQLMSGYGTVEAIDAWDEAITLSRTRGVAARQADLNCVQLPAGRYDLVTAIDVLYHTGIRDDIAVMKRIRESLRPGGMIIVNLVAHEFLRSTHDVAVHTRERYTRIMACERLRSAGLSPERITYRLAVLFPLIAVYRLAARLLKPSSTDARSVPSDVTLPHPLINALLLRIVRWENRFLQTASLPVGTSVFCVARKISPA